MQVELHNMSTCFLAHSPMGHLNRQVAAGGGRRGRGARCAGSGPGSLGAGLRGPVKPSSRPTGVSQSKITQLKTQSGTGPDPT